MKERLYFFFCIFLLVGLVACDGKDDPTPDPEPGPGSAKTRTVLVYLAGDNLLKNFASEDLKEMLEGVRQMNGRANHLLVYIDQGRSARLVKINKNAKGDVVETIIKEYGNRNSVGITEMQDVFDVAFSSTYRADSYGLVLWSHGEGWIPSPTAKTRWWGQDTGRGNRFMDILDLNAVISEAPHFDFIYFDACFMQTAEVVYELRNYTDYIIGCATETPSPGAPYDAVVPIMLNADKTAVDVAKAVYGFYSDKDVYTGSLPPSWTLGDPWTAGASISVVDTDKLEALAAATSNILSTYFKNKATTALNTIFRYDPYRSPRYYYDLDRFINQITNGNADYVAWAKTLKEVMIYYGTTKVNYSAYGGTFPTAGSAGLAAYILQGQSTSFSNYYKKLQWYTAAGWNTTGW